MNSWLHRLKYRWVKPDICEQKKIYAGALIAGQRYSATRSAYEIKRPIGITNFCDKELKTSLVKTVRVKGAGPADLLIHLTQRRFK